MASWVIRADNEGCAYTQPCQWPPEMADGAQQLADAMLLLAIYPKRHERSEACVEATTHSARGRCTMNRRWFASAGRRR